MTTYTLTSQWADLLGASQDATLAQGLTLDEIAKLLRDTDPAVKYSLIEQYDGSLTALSNGNRVTIAHADAQ